MLQHSDAAVFQSEIALKAKDVFGAFMCAFCSSAVAATCDALSITSLVARKLLGVTFSLVRKGAGKPLLHWWRCGARRGR